MFALARAEAMKAMLAHWHQTYVPMHFTEAANKRYAYQPRKGDNEPPGLPRTDGRPGTRANPHYSWVKWRRYRHRKPLVWSGESERLAKNAAMFRISATSRNRMRGEFVGMPSYWFRYHKGGYYKRRHLYGGIQFVHVEPQPNKADELTRVTPAELEDMTRVGERRIVEYIRHYRSPTTAVA
jgi:hypothetical protein